MIEARQAGPAAGYYLRAAGADFRILEAARTSGAALNAAGALITQAGRTPVPGLYTLGRPW
ncbi:hypothetical protein [Kocuria flava]|uniref:hypothetical protein n=1 Tax=Kocuria flava TaxID=446860 RepID=UPI002F936766